MNDLQLLDKYCETCLDYINPFLIMDVEQRGLGHLVNRLPNNVEQAKAVIRARLAVLGRTFGDEQIDQVANNIKRLEALRSDLNNSNMADAHKILPMLEEMKELFETNLNLLK